MTDLENVFVIFPERRSMGDGQESDSEGYSVNDDQEWVDRRSERRELTSSVIVESLLNRKSDRTGTLVENRILYDAARSVSNRSEKEGEN